MDEFGELDHVDAILHRNRIGDSVADGVIDIQPHRVLRVIPGRLRADAGLLSRALLQGVTTARFDRNLLADQFQMFLVAVEQHCKGSRRVAAYIGEKLGNTVITNFWMPDGMKDIPADRYGARLRMKEAYDEIFREPISTQYNKDAIESKVFGIGAESFTVGSGEFCLGYAAKNNKLLTLDTGHFHPTEYVSDKISSTLLFLDEILLHVSRPVRWDSDHVVIFDDELKAIASEIIRGNFTERVHIGLDFFDGSINRIAAWVIGTRAMQKALLYALLEPSDLLRDFEVQGDYTSRLALMEELKTLPFAAVFDMYCESQNIPVRDTWLSEVKAYEKNVLLKRQ